MRYYIVRVRLVKEFSLSETFHLEIYNHLTKTWGFKSIPVSLLWAKTIVNTMPNYNVFKNILRSQKEIEVFVVPENLLKINANAQSGLGNNYSYNAFEINNLKANVNIAGSVTMFSSIVAPIVYAPAVLYSGIALVSISAFNVFRNEILRLGLYNKKFYR